MLRTCEICGAQEQLRLNEIGKALDIVACRNCGLVWNYAMREAAEQEHFYRAENRAGNRLCRGKLISRLSRAACVLDFLGPDLTRGMRHLDVGCAEGTLLALTRSRGLQVTGLELDTHWSTFARESRLLNVLPTSLEESPLAPTTFDLISFVHVVEHLAQPARTLIHAHGLLEDDGYLYVEVPNLNQPLPGLRRFFRPLHNYYFTANTLRSLVAKAGFTPVRLGCSRRDASIQLLSVKAPCGHPDALVPRWHDDVNAIWAHVNGDRKRHYLMWRLLQRWIQQQSIKQWAVRRFGALFPELEQLQSVATRTRALGLLLASTVCSGDLLGSLADAISAAC